MIQRKQSLYLLFATALMAATLLTPFATMADGGAVVFDAFGFQAVGDQGNLGALAPTPILGALLCAACALPFIAIFCYRKRMVQIWMCRTEVLLLAVCQAMLVFYMWLSEGFGTAALSVTGVFPLVAMVLVWLAMRGIWRDEKLVRSLNRIR